MQSELKLCPFCGTVVVVNKSSINGNNYYMITCTGCGANIGPRTTELSLITDWNRRNPAEQLVDDFIEFMDEMIEDTQKRIDTNENLKNVLDAANRLNTYRATKEIAEGYKLMVAKKKSN